MKRITFAIHGGKYQPSVSIFCTCVFCAFNVITTAFAPCNVATMRSSSGMGTAIGSVGEPKRAYQVVKFLVGLANRSVLL